MGGTTGAVHVDVLIVDDHDDTRTTLEMVLSSEGYRCATARSGGEALATLWTMPSTPRLILLDYSMPEGNAPDVLDALRADPTLARIPVVILSGDARAIGPGMDLGVQVVAKPCEPGLLLDVVGRFCPPPASG